MWINVRQTQDFESYSLFFFCLAFCRYTVMSGTPEKILEHLLETIKLECNGNYAIGDTVKITDTCYLLLKRMFRPSQLLCNHCIMVMIVSLQILV